MANVIPGHDIALRAQVAHVPQASKKSGERKGERVSGFHLPVRPLGCTFS